MSALNASNNNPTYEILDKNAVSQMPKDNSVLMDILKRNEPYYMYPFLQLLKDGSVFVFVNTECQLFEPGNNRTIKELPSLPGGHRTYPSTGGSVMLPLSMINDFEPEIMICGGGREDSYGSPTEASCGRIQPLSLNPQWQLTYMPEGRVMVEGVNLLDGSILWINGAKQGAQGFGIADHPAFTALIYNPDLDKWYTAGNSTIARLYHSVALMLPDATILVTGSNPNEQPLPFPAVNGGEARYLNASSQYARFPTEYRNEIYTPFYLQGVKKTLRPTDITISKKTFTPGTEFTIRFKPAKPLYKVETILYTGGFVTHSVHMGQMMFRMQNKGWVTYTDGFVVVEAKIPDVKLAPGPYWIYLMANGVPGMGQYVLVQY